jgi:hypothetical protein
MCCIDSILSAKWRSRDPRYGRHASGGRFGVSIGVTVWLPSDEPFRERPATVPAIANIC